MQTYISGVNDDDIAYQDQLIEERHKEITELLKMQMECNELMGHIAHLVSDQGFIVDDIWSNIKDSSKNVDDGKESLGKAEDYQKNETKLSWIAAAIASISVITGGILTVSLI